MPALLSLIVPGSGQFYLGHRQRAIGILLSIIGLGASILYLDATVLLVPLALLWLWNVKDAYRLAQGSESGIGTAILIGAFILYGLSIVATRAEPARIITGFPSVVPYLRSLANPELFTYPTRDVIGTAPILVPCVEPLPEPDRQPTLDPRLIVNVPCAEVGEFITVRGEGFEPLETVELFWINPIGDTTRVIEEGVPFTVVADEAGSFEVTFDVPLAVPITQLPEPGETQTHTIRAAQFIPFGALQPTETLDLVLEKIGETIALAFMATVLGVIFAVPLSFLAARNLMGGNPITETIYVVTRTFLNVVRSIETLMWAIIFAVWVGLGPFGGLLALWFHTVAALGKLYSEAVESIDPGPIEAIRATGARGPQVVVYGVLPQILPTFTAFTVYRFDINVRLSTVIGLISDVGLGFLIIQWIRLNRLSSMATALIAIIIVVASLDYISGWLRERIIEGTPAVEERSPLRRMVTRAALAIIFVVAFVWSWDVSQISFVELVRGAPEGLRLAASFAVPDFFDRPTEEHVVSEPLPVPCGVVEEPDALEGAARIELTPPCGEVGDPLLISATGLPPNTQVSVRWNLPGDAFLRVQRNCCVTDDEGQLALETRISPLMTIEEGAEEPNSVAIVWTEVVGPPQFSDSFIRVVELSLVTLLMAFLATTIGSIFAIPLSFLAARNVMGDTRAGRAVYYLFRTAFNLLRSIEPLILVLITAAWVGVGPFAGVIALALSNIPNLGKLFSESIEEIDSGPVEAVTATGANRLQTLVFAAVPQLVTPFLAFILYQWDINIRLSTVIGFVGGGGIGQQFRIWVSLSEYSAAGMATWAIVAMVWTMDYLSARAREELA